MFLDPCSSFQVVRLLTLVVGSFLTLTLVPIRILTWMIYLLWALDAVTPRPSRSLTGFTFPLMTPSPVSLLSLSTDSLWHHRLGHSCGSRVSSLVQCGLLACASRSVSLDYQVCWLCKQVQLPLLRINPNHPPMMIFVLITFLGRDTKWPTSNNSDPHVSYSWSYPYGAHASY